MGKIFDLHDWYNLMEQLKVLENLFRDFEFRYEYTALLSRENVSQGFFKNDITNPNDLSLIHISEPTRPY